jgi:hypothetical protein
MRHAVQSDAVLTAFAAINVLREDPDFNLHTISVYAPRDRHVNEFLERVVRRVEEDVASYLTADTVVTMTAAAGDNPIGLLKFSEPGLSTPFIIMTVSEFPNFANSGSGEFAHITSATPLDALTWTVPVRCGSSLVYTPRLLLPGLMMYAFSTNQRMFNALSSVLRYREVNGYDMQVEKTRALFEDDRSGTRNVVTDAPSLDSASGDAAEDSSQPAAPASTYDAECTTELKRHISESSWDILDMFARWFLEQPTLQMSDITMPRGYDVTALTYLHNYARQQLYLNHGMSALDVIILSSKASVVNRVGFAAFLVMPYFLLANSFTYEIVSTMYF